MGIESVKNLLDAAQKASTSVIAFDALDYDTVYACVKGAEAARRPVILMLYPAMNKIISFRAYAELVKTLARDASVPVALHLDHCSDYDTILAAIHAGFTSVMADGSALPFDENVAFTKSVVDVAKAFEVDVEGELGHVGQVLPTTTKAPLPCPRKRHCLRKKPASPRWRWPLAAATGLIRSRPIWIWSGCKKSTQQPRCRLCCTADRAFRRIS